MSEKLTESITLKCTSEEKAGILQRARSSKQPVSKQVREICRDWLSGEKKEQININEISVIGEQLNSLLNRLSLATDTSDTFQLELVPKPIHKPQVQKKPNCCEQMSLFAVHPESKRGN